MSGLLLARIAGMVNKGMIEGRPIDILCVGRQVPLYGRR